MKIKITIVILTLFLGTSMYFNYKAYPMVYAQVGTKYISHFGQNAHIITFFPKAGFIDVLKAWKNDPSEEGYKFVRRSNEGYRRLEEKKNGNKK